MSRPRLQVAWEFERGVDPFSESESREQRELMLSAEIAGTAVASASSTVGCGHAENSPKSSFAGACVVKPSPKGSAGDASGCCK